MKQRNVIGWACLLAWALAAPACRQTPQEMSLAGEWQFALDPKDVGMKEEWQGQSLPETLYLPGSLQEQGKGEDIGLDTKWTGQIVDISLISVLLPVMRLMREAAYIALPKQLLKHCPTVYASTW